MKMRTITITVVTDSEDSLNFISEDVKQELNCCSTYFESITVTEEGVGNETK